MPVLAGVRRAWASVTAASGRTLRHRLDSVLPASDLCPAVCRRPVAKQMRQANPRRVLLLHSGGRLSLTISVDDVVCILNTLCVAFAARRPLQNLIPGVERVMIALESKIMPDAICARTAERLRKQHVNVIKCAWSQHPPHASAMRFAVY